MKKDKDRKPWNPYPLACLKVDGLSACAKTILIYLGVRSNYMGETCVGHRTMCRELVRSKDFVTKGLAELVTTGFVAGSQRDRHKHQADWRKLSASLILPGRTESSPDLENISPAQQDQTSMSSPDFQMSSPAQQGKTSQIDSNLPDSNSEPTDVSKTERVSEREREKLASLAAAPRALGNMEESNLSNLLNGLYGSKRADGAIQISGDIYSRVVMAHPDYRWTDYNCHVMEKMLRSSQWKKTATLADFAFRWESQNPKGLHGQAMRDYDDDESLDEAQCDNVNEPFDTSEPDADNAVSVPKEESPKSIPPAWFELQCERCKRGVRTPPSYGKAVWQCDKTKLGCGAMNKVPDEILALINGSNKREEQYFPQAAD